MKQWNKFLSILLALCILTSTIPITSHAASNDPLFTDVVQGDWCYDAVRYVYERGMMRGTSKTTFSPGRTTTRGMLVTILHRLEGSPNAGEASFIDVAQGQYYTDAVAWGNANNIISGYGDGRFGPGDPITRQQMAAVLYRYADYKGDVPSNGSIAGFADYATVSSYAIEPLKWAVGEGLICGFSDNTLAPQGNATRAQMATILMRFCKKTDVSNGTHIVTFDYNYDNRRDTQTVEDGKTVVEPARPTRNNRKFLGWFTDAVGGDPFDFETPVAQNLVLYAHWQVQRDNNSLPTPVVPDNGKQYTVTFDVNGIAADNMPKAQYVKDGACAVEPEAPQKEGFTFIGWYLSKGYSSPYDFTQPVHSDITVYAKWADMNDAADSDGDGLSDSLEKEFGSDPTKEDTDNDGLSDYLELNWLNYNPGVSDSDKNGVSDADEDPDKDGLTNEQEAELGTLPIYDDSDNDLLSDEEEVNVYHTNPLNKDTDQDGVTDGIEVNIGSDPLAAETSFETQIGSGVVGQVNTVTAAATVETDAEGAGTLRIEEVTPADNPLLSPSIPGYLGSAYDFHTEGTLQAAQISFTYDTSLGQVGEDFQPRIYYVNEQTGLLEELPDQIVEDGKVQASVPHFSTYILLNKVAFDKVWETEIKKPIEAENGTGTIDVSFVIDCSGSMYGKRLRTSKAAIHTFIGALEEKDRAALISFSDYAYLMSNLTTEKQLVNKQVDNLDATGGTAMYRGLNSALDLFADGNQSYGYKMIILLSDGYDMPDTYYERDYAPLVQRAIENKVTIYTIGAGSNANTSMLTKIANATGGNYYEASVTDGITDAFDQIKGDTVDLTTDTNNDGISDYYTKLLNDGVLSLSSGSFDLVDVTEMYGEMCDDWDGDGLKNGEEVEVSSTDSKIYVHMKSNPLLVDTDGDGYTDFDETKNGTPPMKFTSDRCNSLAFLEDDNHFVYPDVANETGFLSGITSFFDWQKEDEAKSHLINYFYDYASAQSITKNQKAIERMKVQEKYLQYAQSLANLAKTAKNICNVADDVSTMVGGIDNTDNAKEFIDSARAKKIRIKGASAQIRASRVKILDAINTNKMTDTTLAKTVMSDITSLSAAIEDFGTLFEQFDPASFVQDVTSTWKIATSGVSAAVGTIKMIYDHNQYMKLDTGFKAISDGYKDFLKSKNVHSMNTYIGVALEVVDGGLDIWETCNTYGKMKANRDAYVSYIDLLYDISQNADYRYVQTAAGKVADVAADKSWATYDKQLLEASGKTVVLTALSIAADFSPYTKVAKLVFNIIKMSINVTGMAENARLYVSCRTMKSVSDSCINIVESNIVKQGKYFSYDTSDLARIEQLAQCRLVGDNYAKERLQKNDLAGLIGRWLGKMDAKSIEDCFRMIAQMVYTHSKYLDLSLSDALPYYNEFYRDASVGGR